MRSVLLFLFVLLSFYTIKAQCPPGARALHYIWIFTGEHPGPPHTDTSCGVSVSQFPVNSRVYVYNNSSVLIDSTLTNAAGYGNLDLSPNRCLTFGVGSVVGTAVCGSCTTNITGFGLLPIKIKSFTINISNNKVTSLWQLAEENSGIKYSLQESNNGKDFTTIYTVINNTLATPGRQYQYQLPQVITSKRFYRLMITEQTGAVEFSDIKTALPKGYNAMDIYPTISNGNLSITMPSNFVNGEIKICNTSGSIIQTKKITASFLNIMVANGKGLYYVKALAPDGSILVKTILVQ